MPVDLFPSGVDPASYRYQPTFEDVTEARDSVELEDAPEGYPGKPSTVTGPLPPTLSRMHPGWAAYQPPPTSTGGQQFQQMPPPPPMPTAGGPKKRAFLCGINYLGQSCRLNGCITDANCMEYLLKTKFQFAQENILLFRDDHPDPLRRPTRANIFMGWQWLLGGVGPGDSLVFHYSGHGSQKIDYSGEELDGKNETLCPSDFQTAGEIIDDEISARLVNPLPQGVRLHAVIDSCHSGSVLDLPYQATVANGYARWNAAYAGRTRAWKGTAGGFAVQFSAATDQQTAADTASLSGGVSTGAATFSFIKSMEALPNPSYGDLLLSMHRILNQAGLGGGGGGGGGLPPPMMGGGLDSMLMAMLGGAGGGAGFRGQEPVLSSNYAFDLSAKCSL